MKFNKDGKLKAKRIFFQFSNFNNKNPLGIGSWEFTTFTISAFSIQILSSFSFVCWIAKGRNSNFALLRNQHLK